MSYQFYSENDVCEDLEHASDHLEGVVEALYDGNKSLEDLEFCIEEMCAALDVPFPKNKKLKVEKKENEVIRNLEDYHLVGDYYEYIPPKSGVEKSDIEKTLTNFQLSSNNLLTSLENLPKVLEEIYIEETNKSMEALANSLEKVFEKKCSDSTEERTIELQVASE